MRNFPRSLATLAAVALVGARGWGDEPVPAPSSAPLPQSTAEQTPSGPGFHHHELWTSWSAEPGVTSRMLLDYFGRYDLSALFSVDYGASLSFFDQQGLSLIGVGVEAHFVNAHADVVLDVEQERWPGWSVTENRAVLSIVFHPIEAVSIMLGGGYRAPIFESTTFWQSLSWTGNSPEISIAYRLDVRLFRLFERYALFLKVWNYDRMRLYTSDNVHFSLCPAIDLGKGFKALGEFGTAAKGVSGGVISWDQSLIAAGVRYEIR